VSNYDFDRERFERKRLEMELRVIERQIPTEFRPDEPLHLRVRALVELSQNLGSRVKIAKRDSLKLGQESRANRWIPVTERLPEKGPVLANRYGYMQVAEYDQGWWTINGHPFHPAPTHWRPLPPLPEETDDRSCAPRWRFIRVPPSGLLRIGEAQKGTYPAMEETDD
jgi:hypothetical protein